jgi:uncharacterized membrane protein YqaE (UPF0057 family)
MKNKLVQIFTVGIIAIMASCSTSSDVASNRKIQKRKYNKGFFKDSKQISGTSKKVDNSDVAVYTELIENVEIITEDNTVQISNETKVISNTENASVSIASTEITNNSTPLKNTSNNEVILGTENITSSNLIENNSNVANNRIAKLISNRIKSKTSKLANSGSSDSIVLLYILCFFIPFLAVGLATDWDVKKVVVNILLTMLCGIPGIIHAIIVVSKNA